MREIMFRGLTKARKWVYGYLTAHIRDCTEKYYIQTKDENVYEAIPESVGQFTGRKDKNGKEIYEGDIFKAPHDFGPGGFSVRTASVAFHPEDGYQWNYWKLDELEIIGNIHENPELLDV